MTKFFIIDVLENKNSRLDCVNISFYVDFLYIKKYNKKYITTENILDNFESTTQFIDSINLHNNINLTVASPEYSYSNL